MFVESQEGHWYSSAHHSPTYAIQIFRSSELHQEFRLVGGHQFVCRLGLMRYVYRFHTSYLHSFARLCLFSKEISLFRVPAFFRAGKKKKYMQT